MPRRPRFLRRLSEARLQRERLLESAKELERQARREQSQKRAHPEAGVEHARLAMQYGGIRPMPDPAITRGHAVDTRRMHLQASLKVEKEKKRRKSFPRGTIRRLIAPPLVRARLARSRKLLTGSGSTLEYETRVSQAAREREKLAEKRQEEVLARRERETGSKYRRGREPKPGTYSFSYEDIRRAKKKPT